MCEMRQIGLVNAPLSFSTYLNLRYGADLLDEDVVFRTFDTEDDLTDYVTGSSYESDVKLAMGIVFDSDFGVNDQYHYTLRQNGTNFNNPEESARPVSQTTPRTDIYTQNFYLNDEQCDFQEGGGAPKLGPFGSSCTGQYIYNGVLTVQRLVQDFILYEGGVGVEYTVAEGGVGYVPFPTREYEEDGFYAAIADFIPLIFVLALLYPVSSTLRTLVTEKEQRHVELLKIMSVTQFQLEFTWIISLMAFYIPSGICVTIVGSNFWESTDAGTLVCLPCLHSLYIVVVACAAFFVFIMPRRSCTNQRIISMYFFDLSFDQGYFIICVFISNIFFCTVVSAFFTKATKAVLVGILAYFVGYVVVIRLLTLRPRCRPIDCVKLTMLCTPCYNIPDIFY